MNGELISGLATISMPVIYGEGNPNYGEGFLKSEQDKGKKLLTEYHNKGYHVVAMSSAVLFDVLWNSYTLEFCVETKEVGEKIK